MSNINLKNKAMNTIKRYVPTSNGTEPRKGTLENPYSKEEFEILWVEFNWDGGFVYCMGYVKGNKKNNDFGYSSTSINMDDQNVYPVNYCSIWSISRFVNKTEKEVENKANTFGWECGMSLFSEKAIQLVTEMRPSTSTLRLLKSDNEKIVHLIEDQTSFPADSEAVMGCLESLKGKEEKWSNKIKLTKKVLLVTGCHCTIGTHFSKDMQYIYLDDIIGAEKMPLSYIETILY